MQHCCHSLDLRLGLWGPNLIALDKHNQTVTRQCADKHIAQPLRLKVGSGDELGSQLTLFKCDGCELSSTPDPRDLPRSNNRHQHKCATI